MIPRIRIRYHRRGDTFPVTIVAYGERDTERATEDIARLEASESVVSVEVFR